MLEVKANTKKDMKKVYYVLSGFIISIILLLTLQSKVYAAEASIEASPSSVEKGESVTINADIEEASAWSLDISTTGGKLTKVDSRAGTTESGYNESSTVKVGTFTSDKAGTYTITLSGYVVDGVSLTKKTVSGKVEITVTEPAPEPEPQPGPQPQPEPEPEPEQPKVEEKPNFKDTNKTMYASNKNGNGINLRSTWSTSSNATYVDNGTELTLTGTSSNKVNGYVWYRVKYDGQTKYVASYLLSDTKPVKEEPVEEPADEPTEQEPTDEPTTADETNEEKTGLTNLEVEGFILTPEFDPEVYEYRVIVKKDISELEINAVPALEGATITIAGNQNLQEGENLITIVVYNAKNEAESTYQITLSKNTLDLTETDKILQMGNKEAKTSATIFLTVFSMTLVALVVVMVLRNRNQNKDYEENEMQDTPELTHNNVEEIEKSTENERTVESATEENTEKENIDTKSEKKKGKHF